MSDRLDLALVSLRQILRATELSSRALAKQCRLTPSQLIMMQIIRNWNGASPGYLAKEVSLTQATITALIDKLEERGLAYRERDEDDKRRVFVKLTEDGLRILDEAPDSLQQRFEAGFSKLETGNSQWSSQRLSALSPCLKQRKSMQPLYSMSVLSDP